MALAVAAAFRLMRYDSAPVLHCRLPSFIAIAFALAVSSVFLIGQHPD
jgi:hypothetical protein